MPAGERSFFDLYAQGFARVAVAIPRVALADPAVNAAEIERLHAAATASGAALVLFPELSLCGYSLEDLHQQEALLRCVLEALERLRGASRATSALMVVGAPLRLEGRLFNCAVVLSRGRILGIVPKSYLPNYREFYEKRQFTSARDALAREAECLGARVPMGADLLFQCSEFPALTLHAEICEDVWAPIPPSTYAALAGATVLANLSASNITVGKTAYRHLLAASQSGRCLAAYLYAAAGQGESTTDLAWDGHGMIYENGELLAESARFDDKSLWISADIDLDRLIQERMRVTSFADCATAHAGALQSRRIVPFSFTPPRKAVLLNRAVRRHPFVPAAQAERDERCYEAYNIQVSALMQRLRSTGIRKVVIGVSGGLDSTQALIVAAHAMDRLGWPRASVLGYALPGYASSQRTRRNALRLMKSLGVSSEIIDIRPSSTRMLKDIGHPFARGRKVYDVTFENVQAGERTSHLFRLANRHQALVVGTGDLSELALGWCTYGVGDQMAHYNVNASVPKTLIRHLIQWVASRQETGETTRAILRDILATAISPELIPGVDSHAPAQSTEKSIGPFDLHDFSLYYTTRRGYRPAKVAYLEACAWARGVPGGPPDGVYTLDEIFRWLAVFLDRFFRLSQFKRSALPNAPKVGSGGSLSPRSDWRAPSDSSARPWLQDLERARAWARRSGRRPRPARGKRA
ncbi:MAG: NAD(+) synthase [Acidobacteria bacterium]|nr:NAD(+) synthase [Acidobacteriota bacterium]